MLCKPVMLLCILAFQLLRLQAQQAYLKQYTVDDGLPSNETYQVMEDNRGNLLVATDRGAVRFNGYSFETIPHQDKLMSLPVYYIYKSPTGKIYYSSLKGSIYQYKQDTLRLYAPSSKSAVFFNHPGLLIANAISESKDSLWISYNNDFNYNFRIGSCFITPSGDAKKLKEPDGIYFDLSRKFYFRQLSAVDYAAAVQPVYISWPDGSLTKDSVELTWRGGYIRRLYHEKIGDFDLFCIGRKLLVYKNRTRVSAYLFPENVLCLTVTMPGKFLVGFENIGARGYQLQSGTVAETKEQLLEGYTVTSIYKDQQNGTWFSTMENGLFYGYAANAQVWQGETKLVSIARRGNKVYAGYYSGKIQEIAGDGQMRDVSLPLSKGSYLSRLSFTHDDSLIALTEKGYFVHANKSWTFYGSQDALLLPVSKTLLFGASASLPELHLYEGLGKGVREKLQLSKRVISMYVDSKQQLWIGTWEGLLKYSNNHLTDFGNQTAAFRDRIVAIGELPDQSLVVASLGNGLVVQKENRFFELNYGNGLRSSVINAMAIDGNDIWLGTNKGLVRVNFVNDSFRVNHFGVESGLPSADVHQFTVCNGRLYLKWVNRLVVIDAKGLTAPSRQLKTYLTSVRINDKELADLNHPTFRHDQNALTFSFACPNLSSARLQEYVYTIEGFDRTWHRTTELYAKYTNLPPGSYVFKVQSSSLRDGTASTIAHYPFTIKAAFWQTQWFSLAVIVASALFVSFVFFVRINSIKKKNQVLLELAENRSKVLSQLIHPHFVSNVLNTIQGAILKQEKMQAASLVSKFAKLMRLSLELSKEKMVLLSDEIELLKKYFELEEIRVPGRFTYDIEVVPPLNPELVMIPSMLIQPFVENAIKHGVMHLQERKGYIHLHFSLGGKALLCAVDDNGVGRERSARLNKAVQSDHQSSGIEITKERLKLLHEEQKSEFFYRVEDKLDLDQKPAGTTTVFSIPYKLSHEANSNGDY